MSRRRQKFLSAVLAVIAFGASVTAFSVHAAENLTEASDRTESNAEQLGDGYTRQGDHVLFSGKRIDREGAHDLERFSKTVGHELTLASDVDASTFEVLSEEYTKDANKAYYKWISPGRFWVVELPDADPETLEVLGFNLARDKNHVWWYGSILPGADAKSIELVSDGFVWKDSAHVWYQQQKMVDADAKTFKHLGSSYFIDDQRVYWGPDAIDDADRNSFRVLNDSFVAVDQNMVYRSGRPAPAIDPATCRFIFDDPYGYQVIADKDGVYLNQLRFLHADPKDFSMVNPRMARGGDYAFLIDTYQCTPVTVYQDGDQLVSETILYDPKTSQPLAVVKAHVTDGGLHDLKLSPAPGQTETRPVPEWQTAVFRRPDLVKQMEQAGDFLAGKPIADSDREDPSVAVSSMQAAPGTDGQAPQKTSDSEDAWKTDIQAFDRLLSSLASSARIPSEDELSKRITLVPGSGRLDSEVIPISDGAGGYVDLRPKKDTLQFLANEKLKGQQIKWEFEVVADTSTNYLGLLMLQTSTKASIEKDRGTPPFLNTIILRAEPGQTLKAGQRVLLEGTIGDANNNQGINLFSGPVAIYHFHAAPHPIFWLGLADATVTVSDQPKPVD